MLEAYKKFFQNYANFKGRATRSEYWYVILMNFIIGFVLGFVGGLIPGLAGLTTVITGIYSLAIIIPSIAIVVRRLHDINKSGWHYFMCLIPIVGFIIVLVYLCKPSVNENNQYNQTA